MIFRFVTTSKVAAGILVAAVLGLSGSVGLSQITNVIDQFNPSGANGFSYSGGQIDSVWTNWFGSAFVSDVWDSTSDANSNVNSGSILITANFNGGANQFVIYDGFNGITPTLNGLLYTNFQCDVRFEAGSATGGFGGQLCFGNLQFGVSTLSFGQDYFTTSANIPASNTNWVHINIPISATNDLYLAEINDVLIHIYGPSYSPPLSGTTTFWVDNIAFTGPTPVNQCTVDWNTTYQRIDGFGASSAWQSTWNSSQADLFFSTNNGILYTNASSVVSTNNGAGLSLLRTRIVYANDTLATSIPSTVEGTIMQMAQARGARVWSTPWTPAAGFKSTNDIYDGSHAAAGGLDGGSFLGSGNNITNVNYASQLANYADFIRQQYGVNLYAISIQNEPDANVTGYEACQWANTQIHDFVTNLNNAFLVKSNSDHLFIPPKIIVPEDENWHTNLLVNAMTDPAVATNVAIVACHDYDGNPPLYSPTPLSMVPNFSNPNAALWETECSLLSGSDSSISNGVVWATRIHYFMTVAQANAWHYWWLMTGNSTGNQGLTDNTKSPTKRLFALGQFSRFVRPNYYRIAANTAGPVLVSAYKDTNSLNYAIVAINPNTTNVAQTFTLSNFPGTSLVTPWITSSNLSLAPQSPVAVTSGVLSYTLPAMSIVTFAGAATNFAPTLTAVQNQTVNAGVTLTVSNFASDIDAPPQTLTFNLLNAPPGASLNVLNATNGVFSWRAPVSSANTTNPITVQVVNNGLPALSATNNFKVIINPLSPATFTSPSVSSNHIHLVVNGPAGPDYTLLSSTNLLGVWQPVLTTNSPVLPWSYTYTNSTGRPDLFFRVELGP